MTQARVTHRGVELVIKHYNEGTHPLNPTP